MGSKRNKKVKSESFEELNDTVTTNNNNVPGDLKSLKTSKKRVTKLPPTRELETSTEISPKKAKKGKQQKTKNKIGNNIVITETINENVNPENRVVSEPAKKSSKNKRIQENIGSSPERTCLDKLDLVENKFDVKSVEIISPPNTELPSAEKTSKRKPKRNKVQSKKAEIVVDVPIESANKSMENHVVKADDPIIIKNTVEENENKDILIQNQHVENKSFQWSDEDFTQLISRMERLIPEKDVLAYSTRVEKLDWNEVAFDKFSSEDCKKAWSELQKHIRRFRLLREVLHDAKEWLKTPQAKKRKMRHPDMPRKPMSSYMIFYLKKKSKIQMEHPGSDAHDITKIASVMFKALTPEKKEKYEKLAAMEREEYKIRMKQFYEDHPELMPQPPEKNRPIKTKQEKPPKPPKPPKMPKPVKPMKPEKPKTPFLYFYKEEFNKLENKEIDKAAFKEICKEKWKNMSDKKKLSWINWAEKRQAEYTEQIKSYMQKNPEFVPCKKNVISKEQMLLKERLAGKPVKPPNSAYSLFSRKYLLSDQIKHIDPRERMNYVSTEWKKLSDEEKKKYQDEVVKLLAEYESAFNLYLQSLPEDKRKEELEKAHPKRKIKPTENNEPPKKKLKTPVAKPKKKFKEPEQPPISAFKYFIKVYKGEDSPVTAWKALTAAEKKKFEDELTEKKRQYIVNFEKFLKSLSKEELEEYSKARKQIVKNDDDDDEDEEEESSNCSSGSEASEEEDCDISS